MSGLAILRALQLTMVFSEFIATALVMDAYMISVERLLQLSEGAEQESDMASVSSSTYGWKRCGNNR
jgi:hypothetical protein